MLRPNRLAAAAHAAAGFLAVVLVATACRAPERDGDARSSASTRRTAADTMWVVEVGAYADSTSALRLRDSLRGEGWSAFLGRAITPGGTRWRVRLLPTRDSVVVQSAATAARLLKGALGDARMVRAEVPPDVPENEVSMLLVSRGVWGSTTQLRWQLSPDGRAIFAVEDASGTADEPEPSSVVLANEATGRVLQAEHVWDAAPSPDWQRLAVSWAFILRSREPSISPERWVEWVRTLPESLAHRVVALPPGPERNARLGEILRTRSFSVSATSAASGVGFVQAFPVDSSKDSVVVITRGNVPSVRVLRVDGSQLRWMRNGKLAVGAGLKQPRESSPPARWIAVHPDSGTLLGLLADTLSFAPTRWVMGPTFSGGRVRNLTDTRIIDAEMRRFELRNGWLRLIENQQARVIGPGLPLATTRSGRFVATLLATDSTTDRRGARLVLYRVP